MKSFSSFKLEEAKATYTIKDSEGNIKHAGTDKDMAYKTHKSLNAKEAGHKLYKNGVATLAEVLNKDAKAGDWISDFIKSDNPKFAGKSEAKRKEMALAAYYAKQNESVDLDEELEYVVYHAKSGAVHSVHKSKDKAENTKSNLSNHKIGSRKSGSDNSFVSEGTMQPNGTDKIQPDEGMCEGLCQVCGATDCKEHFYKSPAVTGYVKEEAEHIVHVDDGSKYDEEPHPKDAEHVMSGVKKHNGKFAGHSDKGAYFKFGSKTDAKNFVDHVKKSPHRSVSADLHESRGHKILATAMANAERMKTVQIPTPAERRAELEKQNKATPKMKNEDLEEQAPVAGSLPRHTVVVHVSDPREPKEPKQRKALSVLAVHSKSAVNTARKHFEKKGWKVHSAAIKEDISVDEAVNTVKTDEKGKVLAWSHEGDWEKQSTKNKQGTGKAANLAGKALQKTKTLNKEEAELEEGLFDNMPNTKAGFAYKDKKRSERQAEHEKQDPKMAVHYAKNMVDTAKAAKKAKERGITKHADDFGWQVRNGVQRGKLPEEVDLDEAWEVYDTKTRVVHSSHPTQRKALNHMNKLNDKHPGYETPGNLIASKFGARVSGLKEELDEATLQAHKVGVTVSDPNHTSVSQRKEKVQKSVIVKATDKGEAQAKAESFYKKKGYKVHDSFHHSVVPATSMKTEEVQIDEAAWGKDKATNLRQAHDRHMEKALAANKAGDDAAVKTHQRKMQMIQGKLQKLKNNEEVELGEECEILSELSKNALGNYAKAAAFDIANKGSAVGKAGNNLAVLANPKGPLTQLNKRLQGHAKAVEKLTKEEVEEFMQTEAYDQLDELDKKTLGNYVKKAHDQLMKHTSSVNFKGGRGDSDAFAYAHDPVAVRKTANRTKGVDQAINKLTKEDNMLTYSEFMASIEEGRIDDLKDKLAADREKRLNKMDYSKEKEAKKNPITKVKGHSYGAGDEDGEAEPAKAAEPAEKRGRGRPAGSKSGARA